MSDDETKDFDEDWYDSDDEPDDGKSVECPECSQPVYDDLDKCPKCGHWLTAADRRQLWPGEQRPAWQRVTAIVMIVVFVVLLFWAGLSIL